MVLTAAQSSAVSFQVECRASTRTLARKLDAVHSTTVTSKSKIPSVRRARPPNVVTPCTYFLTALLDELQEDEETLGAGLVARSSHGTGMVRSAAAPAAGGHGGTRPLIVVLWDWRPDERPRSKGDVEKSRVT